MKVTIVGAGNVGASCADAISYRGIASEVVLLDIKEGFAEGKAMDIMQCATNTGFNTRVSGVTNDYSKTANSDVVVITSGIPRKPGMTREELIGINAGIVKNLVSSCADNCPKALIGIITNPVNTTVAIAAEVLKNKGVYDPTRLFGITTLDVIRSSTFVAEVFNEDPMEVKVPVIGGHSGITILPLLSQSGFEFSDDDAAAMTKRIQNAGTEVVEAKAGGGSATLSMGQAAAKFGLSLVRALNGEKDVIECTYVEGSGELARFFAQPVLLGKNGVEKILNYGTLSDFEQTTLDDALDTLRSDIKIGEEFVK
mgnify:CR=1 FL=1